MAYRRKSRKVRKARGKKTTGIISCKKARNGVPVCKMRIGGRTVTRFVSKKRAAPYL